MKERLRQDADTIIEESIRAVLPDRAVREALKDFCPGDGRVILVAVGKAAWQMASAAVSACDRIHEGIVITKYGHVKGAIPGIVCREAGHPVPDANGFAATAEALKLVDDLRPEDTVLFLVSGGGSALFEQPLIPGEELRDITEQLLACGADIVEMNTIRKRLSAVKGGRFAQAAFPARIYTIVLSDVLGDPLDMIASGPTFPDAATPDQALEIVRRYDLKLSPKALELLTADLPKQLPHVQTVVTGSVKALCAAAALSCKRLGYTPVLLTDELRSEAAEAGVYLANIAKSHAGDGKKTVFIAGGETVVHLTGNGLGGRNQELALAASVGISGMQEIAVFSFGSDGTDGPTDAAGGYVDGDTFEALKSQGIDVRDVLQRNDSYHALAAVHGLIITGPTGTNVNDVSIALCAGSEF